MQGVVVVANRLLNRDNLTPGPSVLPSLDHHLPLCIHHIQVDDADWVTDYEAHIISHQGIPTSITDCCA